MTENFDLIIPDSCTDELKAILKQYLIEGCDELIEIRKKLIKHPRSLRLWQALDKKPPEDKEHIASELLYMIDSLYKGSSDMDIYSANKKKIDLLRKKYLKVFKELDSIGFTLTELKMVSIEDRKNFTKHFKKLFHLTTKALNPDDLSGLYYGDDFINAKNFRKKGQKNARRIYLTIMLQEEFKAALGQPLYVLAFIIPHILLGIEIPEMSEEKMKDSAKKAIKSVFKKGNISL